MADFEVRLDDSAWREFMGAMKGRLHRGNDALVAAYSTIGIGDVMRHFRDQAGPDGPWRRRLLTTDYHDAKVYSGQWKPWPGTRRSWYDPSRPLLVFSGRMRKGVLAGRSHARHAGQGKVVISNPMPYSGKHDEGIGVQKREFMWLSDDAQQNMVNAVAAFVFGETD